MLKFYCDKSRACTADNECVCKVHSIFRGAVELILIKAVDSLTGS